MELGLIFLNGRYLHMAGKVGAFAKFYLTRHNM